MRIVFFGTPTFALPFLLDLTQDKEIEVVGVVTQPDKPADRGQKPHTSPVKVLAQKHNIQVFDFSSLKTPEVVSSLGALQADAFVVVAYGKIIPIEVLNIPKHKSINIHYSLLPHLRGAAPVEGAILADERETGVSIILMDEKMDHGQLLAQENVSTPVWPLKRSDLLESMNLVANKLLVETILKWVAGEITPKEQDHTKATFVKMIKKEDALIDLNDDDYLNFRKIMAYEKWPRAYFLEDNKRIIINEAIWKDDKLEIVKGLLSDSEVSKDEYTEN